MRRRDARRLRRANRRGHDVALLQIVSKQEVELPFSVTTSSKTSRLGHTYCSIPEVSGRVSKFDRRVPGELAVGAKRDGFDFALMTTMKRRQRPCAATAATRSDAMTWWHPGPAWAGGRGAPIIAHWLARHRRRDAFSDDQFLVRSSPVSAPISPEDLRLLAVRAGITAAAAFALAQPLWVRPGAPAARPARAIVLDTSASVLVFSPMAAWSRSGARDRGRGGGGSGTSPATNPPTVTIEAERLSDGVAKAGRGSRHRPHPRVGGGVGLQVGALVKSDLDPVPEAADVRLLPIRVSGPVPAVPAPAADDCG